MVDAWRCVGDEDYVGVADFNSCSAYTIASRLAASGTPSDLLHREALPGIPTRSVRILNLLTCSQHQHEVIIHAGCMGSIRYACDCRSDRKKTVFIIEYGKSAFLVIFNQCKVSESSKINPKFQLVEALFTTFESGAR